MDRDDTLAKVLFDALEAFVDKAIPNNPPRLTWEDVGPDADLTRDLSRAGADAVEAAIKARA